MFKHSSVGASGASPPSRVFGSNFLQRTVRRLSAHVLLLRASSRYSAEFCLHPLTSSWLRRRWIHPRRIMFFIEEKQTENRVFGSNFLSMYARPSKVFTTEKLVFFSDNYEILSGQGNHTAVPRGRQTERPAVESPHDREARLFSDDKRWRGGAGTLPFRCYFLLV